MIIKWLLVFVLSCNLALADDAAVYLNKGQQAGFSGFLVPQAKIVEFRNTAIERDSLQQQNASLAKSLSLQDDMLSKDAQKLKIMDDQNDRLAIAARSAQSMNTLEKIGWVFAGVAAVSLGAYSFHQLNR